jgi:aerobic carbon-monoxide dehydrogenase medium subunit
MRNFDLLEPKTIQEACQLLGEGDDVRLIGGGTALLILIKQGLVRPKSLINLKKLEGARTISYDPRSGLRIEALATIHEVETSSVVREHFPVLAQACHQVANIRIRHLATMGGNLAHGDHQSDPPGVLVALDASIELSSSNGTRTVRLADFLVGLYETTLGVGEMVTAVLVPPTRGRLLGKYVKFTTGSSEERPCAGVTALIRLEQDRPVEARLAIGAVGPTPLLVCEMNPSKEGMVGMADRAARDVDPIADLRGSAAYKRHLVGVLGRRALLEVWEEVAIQ